MTATQSETRTHKAGVRPFGVRITLKAEVATQHRKIEPPDVFATMAVWVSGGCVEGAVNINGHLEEASIDMVRTMSEDKLPEIVEAARKANRRHRESRRGKD